MFYSLAVWILSVKEHINVPSGVGNVKRETCWMLLIYDVLLQVDNIKANSVTITCSPLDLSQLDYSQLEKHADIKESDLEYFVCCGESVDKQRIFTAGTAPQLTLQLVELRPNTEYLVW